MKARGDVCDGEDEVAEGESVVPGMEFDGAAQFSLGLEPGAYGLGGGERAPEGDPGKEDHFARLQAPGDDAGLGLRVGATGDRQMDDDAAFGAEADEGGAARVYLPHDGPVAEPGDSSLDGIKR